MIKFSEISGYSFIKKLYLQNKKISVFLIVFWLIITCMVLYIDYLYIMYGPSKEVNIFMILLINIYVISPFILFFINIIIMYIIYIIMYYYYK